jgi:hypothetical protein
VQRLLDGYSGPAAAPAHYLGSLGPGQLLGAARISDRDRRDLLLRQFALRLSILAIVAMYSSTISKMTSLTDRTWFIEPTI